MGRSADAADLPIPRHAVVLRAHPIVTDAFSHTPGAARRMRIGSRIELAAPGELHDISPTWRWQPSTLICGPAHTPEIMMRERTSGRISTERLDGSDHASRRNSRWPSYWLRPVSYTHLRAHETDSYLVCRLLLEKK